SHLNLYRKPPVESLTARVLHALADRRADTLLKAAAFQLARAGIRLVSAMPHLKPLLPAKGALTRREPDEDEWKDIRFGLGIARGLAGLDVGQTAVVKGRAVVALEALEGTDAAIRRAGALCGAGAVVVKVAKPRQDFRFDVPVVGTRTIESLVAARATVMAVEAGKTILLNRLEVIARADAAGLCLVAV
ncbi:MAG: LpxI family protein, partial [bacterium]